MILKMLAWSAGYSLSGIIFTFPFIYLIFVIFRWYSGGGFRGKEFFLSFCIAWFLMATKYLLLGTGNDPTIFSQLGIPSIVSFISIIGVSFYHQSLYADTSEKHEEEYFCKECSFKSKSADLNESNLLCPECGSQLEEV